MTEVIYSNYLYIFLESKEAELSFRSELILIKESYYVQKNYGRRRW